MATTDVIIIGSWPGGRAAGDAGWRTPRQARDPRRARRARRHLHQLRLHANPDALVASARAAHVARTAAAPGRAHRRGARRLRRRHRAQERRRAPIGAPGWRGGAWAPPASGCASSETAPRASPASARSKSPASAIAPRPSRSSSTRGTRPAVPAIAGLDTVAVARQPARHGARRAAAAPRRPRRRLHRLRVRPDVPPTSAPRVAVIDHNAGGTSCRGKDADVSACARRRVPRRRDRAPPRRRRHARRVRRRRGRRGHTPAAARCAARTSSSRSGARPTATISAAKPPASRGDRRAGYLVVDNRYRTLGGGRLRRRRRDHRRPAVHPHLVGRPPHPLRSPPRPLRPRAGRDRVIPSSVFTDPQVARIGLNEAESARRQRSRGRSGHDALWRRRARHSRPTRRPGSWNSSSTRATSASSASAIVGANAGELIHIFVAAGGGGG